MKIALLLLCLCINFVQSSKEDFVSGGPNDFSWPRVCKRSHRGKGAPTTYDDDRVQGRRCTVISKMYVKPDNKAEMQKFCEKIYPDYLINFEYDAEKHKIKCIYRSEFSCEPHQFHIRGQCFDVFTAEVPFEEAKGICERVNGTVAKADDGTMFYFAKMYALENLHIIWVEGYGKQANKSMIYVAQNDPFEPSRTIGEIIHVRKPENHSVVCEVKSTKIPTSPVTERNSEIPFIDLCVLLRALNIKAKKIEDTCFSWTQSVVGGKSVKNAKKKDVFTNVDHFHDKCKFGDLTSYAVSPTSHKGYEAIKEMQSLREGKGNFLIPAVLVENWTPALNTKSDQALKLRKSLFAYIQGSKDELKMAETSYWDASQPSVAIRDGSLYDFPSTILAFNKNQKLENTIALMRSPIICSQGVEHIRNKHYHCPKDWVKRDREQGPSICYKYEQAENNVCIDYDEGKVMCEKMGGYMATMQNEGEEEAITDTITGVLGNGTKSMSIWLGATDRNYNATLGRAKTTSDYHWDIDGTPVASFLRWSDGEPNRMGRSIKGKPPTGEYESCLSIVYLSNNIPLWNDLHCKKEYNECGQSAFSVRSVVCAKEAGYKFDTQKKV